MTATTEEAIHPAETLREQIGEYATRLGNGTHRAPAWYVACTDKTGVPEPVTILRLHGPDVGYTKPSYAELADGRRVTSTYLFSARPSFLLLQDSFGLCHNWAVA
jgi:hypothetical protein